VSLQPERPKTVSILTRSLAESLDGLPSESLGWTRRPRPPATSRALIRKKALIKRSVPRRLSQWAVAGRLSQAATAMRYRSRRTVTGITKEGIRPSVVILG